MLISLAMSLVWAKPGSTPSSSRTFLVFRIWLTWATLSPTILPSKMHSYASTQTTIPSNSIELQMVSTSTSLPKIIFRLLPTKKKMMLRATNFWSSPSPKTSRAIPNVRLSLPNVPENSTSPLVVHPSLLSKVWSGWTRLKIVRYLQRTWLWPKKSTVQTPAIWRGNLHASNPQLLSTTKLSYPRNWPVVMIWPCAWISCLCGEFRF